MKYSFMSFSCPDVDLDGMLALAEKFGYDGIEPRIASGHAHGLELDLAPAGRAAARGKAEDSGIAICCVATSCSYAAPDTCRQNIDDTLRSIDLAADVGAGCIRVFGGKIPAPETRESAIDALAGALRAVADHAQERSVVVCLETHDDWCDPAHVAAVIQRADHPAIAVNWDIMHPVRVAGATMADAFAVLGRWVRHIHFHDGVKADTPPVLRAIGQGEIDHLSAVQLLQNARYDGYLSGEWIDWEPYEVHLPRELATMRNYEERGG